MRPDRELTTPIMKPADDADPQLELLTALVENNMDAFRHYLALPTVDVDHLYKAPYNCTCLHYAVKQGRAAAVAALLARGARTDVRDRAKSTPLHYAAQAGLDELARALLAAGADVNAKDAEERTCLHLLAQRWSDAPAACERVLDALLAAPGVAVDDRDCSQCSPLLLAARRGAAELCRRLVERGADLDCRVGRHWARELIQQKCAWVLETEQAAPAARDPGQRLYEALTAERWDEFAAALEEVRRLEEPARQEALERAHGNYTCLQFAADNGLADCVRRLLDAGADAATVSHANRYSALHYACFHGYHEVLRELLAAAKEGVARLDLDHRDSAGQTVLHKVAKRTAKQRKNDARVDFRSCLEQLLDCGLPLNVNAQDDRGNTALHFAALNEDQSFVAPLLLRGASIGIKNVFGTMPMTRIQSSAMEAALDQSVRSNGDAPGDNSYRISFHYDCLIPPENADGQLPFSSETAPLFFIGQSRPHQRLLHHPILNSFLLLKWQKIQPLYLLNLALYAVFVAVLTAYVYLEFDVSTTTGEVRPSPAVAAGGLIAMEVVLGLAALLLAARELCQLSLSWRAYVSHRENYLQLALIVLLAVVLLDGNMSQLTRLHVAVWAIILAWLEWVLLLGRHPRLSTYIMMFKTVSENFFKFIFLYSFLIIAFSIAFNLLFRTDEHFNTYWRALLKTVVMSTGEMEYTALEFSRSAYSGHIAFFGFLFLIALVLMNLLNGLAVSDTAAIQADAELHSLISRVSLIHYIETVFLAREMCTGCGKTAGQGLDRFKTWLAHKTLLFPRCLKARKLSVCPNSEDTRFFGCDCHRFKIDERIVEAAQLLLARGEHVLNDRMEAMERKLDKMMQMMVEMKGSS